jgi:hypothetical protein
VIQGAGLSGFKHTAFVMAMDVAPSGVAIGASTDWLLGWTDVIVRRTHLMAWRTSDDAWCESACARGYTRVDRFLHNTANHACIHRHSTVGVEDVGSVVRPKDHES